MKEKGWRAIRAGGDPQQKTLTFFISRLIHKVSLFIQQKTKHYTPFTDWAVARSSYFLFREAKKHKADIYIGHNLGALPATVKVAKYHKSFCGFDAEDFHRNEMTNDIADYSYKIARQLENRYFGSLNYLTTSSPQTTDAYHRLYPKLQPTTILNVFVPSAGIKTKKVNPDTLKLFWFSQTIGPKRGIEDIANALNTLKNESFELHLLGQTSEAYQQFIVGKIPPGKVYFHPPIPAAGIINFASQFDIGLALETGFSSNNDFALSNKLFTYLQAGLAIIASDTTAQKGFISKYPDVGNIYFKNDSASLASVLSEFNLNRERVYQAGKYALKLGHEKLNWQIESGKLLSLVAETLDAGK